MGIGQGELGVSPLQMACYAATLGNKGTFIRPHVVEKIRDKNTKQFQDIAVDSRKLNVSPAVWEVIRDGMYRCVNEAGGTGAAARVQGITVSGKTGTAENPHGKSHSWFIGYAPSENPKIAICVLVENAGFGGTVAAPIAGLCIEQYLYGSVIRGRVSTIIEPTSD